MKCTVCSDTFRPGQKVQRIPRPEVLMVGGKSGQTGVYADPSSEGIAEEIVHYPECCMGFFDPEHNPYIYDLETERMREELRDEVEDEVKEEYRDKLERITGALASGQRLDEQNICCECWSELQDEKPIMCIFCKKDECVMELRRRDGIYRFCMHCQKWWDNTEKEVAAA